MTKKTNSFSAFKNTRLGLINVATVKATKQYAPWARNLKQEVRTSDTVLIAQDREELLNAGQKLQHEKKVAALSTVLCEQE